MFSGTVASPQALSARHLCGLSPDTLATSPLRHMPGGHDETLDPRTRSGDGGRRLSRPRGARRGNRPGRRQRLCQRPESGLGRRPGRRSRLSGRDRKVSDVPADEPGQHRSLRPDARPSARFPMSPGTSSIARARPGRPTGSAAMSTRSASPWASTMTSRVRSTSRRRARASARTVRPIASRRLTASRSTRTSALGTDPTPA